MNKKALVLVAAALALASAAQAANTYTSAGCGLGTILFKGKNSKVHLILAATTNGSFGNQTFGISSETLDCTAEGVVKNDKQVEVYAAVNLQQLSREMAQGGGEYLSGLSTLMGCKTDAQKQAFSQLAQTRYEKLFPSDSTDSSAMLSNLRSEMSADPVLRTL
jgi:hypothetical protein